LSLLTIAEARALIASGLSDANLQAAIDREEAWLPSIVGTLTGERSQTFYIRSTDQDDPLLLQRPTGAVTVTDDGTALAGSAVRLLRGGTILEKATGSWNGTVVATYTPTDEDVVKAALIDLVRLRITSSPFVAETAGPYSYQRGGSDATRSIEASRLRIARSLLPHRGPTTVRLPNGAASERIGTVVSS
jgi:hypothetical protein